jgi:hypothetical protein
MNYCECKQCKRQRRKGYILGKRLLRHFSDSWFVSDYVRYRKFLKGRARKETE